jgi:hypothetical protein
MIYNFYWHLPSLVVQYDNTMKAQEKCFFHCQTNGPWFHQFRVLSRYTCQMIQVIINLNLRKMNLARKKAPLQMIFF